MRKGFAVEIQKEKYANCMPHLYRIMIRPNGGNGYGSVQMTIDELKLVRNAINQAIREHRDE